MTPDQYDQIEELFDRVIEEKMAYLRHAQRAERALDVFRALALWGGVIVAGFVLQLGISA
ncbi:protein of unknown function [Pseudomonas sp. JV551A1]|uniref:hypothetical protein n=1 Tax=Pseudomonas TaxID=286 RepID=UPI00100D2D92|nr:hypothetical protein [Pseudomonas]SPO56213.1 protein of unknown function [Pseudomonas sp. JV551A1]